MSISKIKKGITLEDYTSIFNFLSKVIYCSSIHDRSKIPFNLRRLCCNDVIQYHSELESAEDIIENNYKCKKAKVEDLYSVRINEDLIISLAACKLKFEKEEDKKFLFPFSISNRIIFKDDPLNITVFVDKDLYDGIDFDNGTLFKYDILAVNNESKYFKCILDCITNCFSNGEEISTYNIIMGNLMYANPDASEEINKIVEYVLNNACNKGTDYISIESKNTFRDILDEYYSKFEYNTLVSLV